MRTMSGWSKLDDTPPRVTRSGHIPDPPTDPETGGPPAR